MQTGASFWSVLPRTISTMPVHAFVDETKVRGLLVVAALLAPHDLAQSRAAMRQLLLPRQSHVHFVKERSDRKGQIIDSILGLPLRLDVYDVTGIKDARAARRACLERLVQDLAAEAAHRLVIEQDESLIRSDREVLYRAVRGHGVAQSLTYEHLTPRNEPLLWILDAAAWCWIKGGHWRRRIDPAVRRVVNV